MSMDVAMEPPAASEEPAALDGSDVLKALHEALEVAFGDDAFAAALADSSDGSWSFGDDGSLTIKVGDAEKVIDAATLQAALAGEGDVEMEVSE